MSDLNDFFAKKDRKKKRAAAAKSAQVAVAANKERAAQPEGGKPETNARGNGAVQQTSQPDDGWIEIEDPRGSQVNTGGRTVAEFRRDAEEKDTSGENAAQTEKFSGWAKGDAAPSEAPVAEKTPSSTMEYPSLADAAKVQTVAPAPPTRTDSNPSQDRFGGRGRPRFIVDKEKLKQKIQERENATGRLPRFIVDEEKLKQKIQERENATKSGF